MGLLLLIQIFGLSISPNLVISFHELSIESELALPLDLVDIAIEKVSHPLAAPSFLLEDLDSLFIPAVAVPSMTDIFIGGNISEAESKHLVRAEAEQADGNESSIPREGFRHYRVEELIVVRQLLRGDVEDHTADE